MTPDKKTSRKFLKQGKTYHMFSSSFDHSWDDMLEPQV